MPSPATVVTFLLGSLVFAIVPGPTVFFIIGRAIAAGRRVAVASALGNLLGVVIMLGAVSVGIGALLGRAVAILVVLKIVGAVYLIWLGVQAWRHRGDLTTFVDGATGPRPRARRAFRDGAIVGLTNPKAVVLLGAVLPQFVDASRPDPGVQMFVLGLLFCALASSIDLLWALVAGTARTRLMGSPQRVRRLGALGGVVMVGLGIGVAATAPSP
jgi:threonine/homoserine/homoserine lactone efflux protein